MVESICSYCQDTIRPMTTGFAVSRRSAHIFWESPRALIFLGARSERDQGFAVVSLTAKQDIMHHVAQRSTLVRSVTLMFVPVRDFPFRGNNLQQSITVKYMDDKPDDK